MRRQGVARGGVLACVAAVLLAGCGHTADEPGTDAPGTVDVVASTDVWGSVAKAVGGGDVDVTSIIDDPAKDPHGYRATPSDAAAIHDAALVVSNGGGYDPFFGKAARAAGGSRRHVVAFDVSGKSAGSGKDAGDVNEHVFYDLPTVKKVARAVAVRLGEIDPANRDTYASNAVTFGRKADELLTSAKSIGKGNGRQRVVVTEPVAYYLLGTAGVTDATPPAFSEAVEKDSAVGAEAIHETTALLRDRKVSALVDNVQTEDATTRKLIATAKSAGLPVVPVTETLPAGEHDYVGWMRGQITDLAEALNG